MADFHPHGDSSIYGALVRLSQNWVMRYPLLDFHGSNGNIDGDGPAHYRYTEARLSKLAEEGLLYGIKKKNVDFIPNYSETKDEPITLPAIFPNLLCNPNSGIGVAMASNWLPHNLCEVADAIYAFMDGKEPTIPGPDFPTGGLIINKNDLPSIVKTGRGSVKLRGQYKMEDNNIVFYEIPYGVATEALMTQIGEACDNGTITGIENIRNESNRKGYRLVIECEKGASPARVLTLLFANTDLQVSISYNQVALVDKVPTELTLKDAIKIYVDHNEECIKREVLFDKAKAESRLEIIEGLLIALEDIDNVISLIKSSESAAAAKEMLMAAYNLTEVQAKAILDMKLAKLAKLEKLEIQKEKSDLEIELARLNAIIANPTPELINIFNTLKSTYGDPRRSTITQVATTKEEKEIEFVEPEKCVVIMTEGGLVKRIPSTSFRTQKRNGKGVKTQDDITHAVIRTNTIDSLMIFSNKGKMYRLLVNDIPVGTNVSKGQSIKSLINMETDEEPAVMYSIYRDTDAQFVLFVTKNGLVKKTSLEEYVKTKKKTGIAAISIKEGDELAAVSLVKDEQLILITKNGMAIRFDSKEVTPTSRATAGVKGIALGADDLVIAAQPVRNVKDKLAIFSQSGLSKKFGLEELPLQKRAGKGLMCYKPTDSTGPVSAAALVEDADNVLILGDKNSICIEAKEIPSLGRASIGNQVIKNSKIISVSKV
jgi:DNA gyrase subunit A